MIGHILRTDEGGDGNIADRTLEERRRKGRSKIMWRKTLKNERRNEGWSSWKEGPVAAADREKWRSSVTALGATRYNRGTVLDCLLFIQIYH